MNHHRRQNMKKTIELILSLFFLFAMADIALADPSAWTVLGSGGGNIHSTNYTLDSTVGQDVIGIANSAGYGLGAGFWYGVTETALDSVSPFVFDPFSNQSSIPTDTDNTPLWGETARMNVSVTDDVEVASVTVNLSGIGGSSDQVMMNIEGNIYSTTTNASANTLPGFYYLTVNATDTSGNSNISVRIQLRVIKNGDCTGNNVVNIGDALRLANNVSYYGNPVYDLSSQYVCEVTGNGIINIGDALRLANNVSYPGNMAYILK